MLERIGGSTMGTTYSVAFVPSKDINTTSLHSQIEQRLAQINQLMSTYISDSELSLLNKHKGAEAFSVSAETAFVIDSAIQLNHLSEGKLDITVGPLVNLWGFGPQARPEIVPNAQQLEDVKKYVGVDKFSLHDNSVVKHHDKVYIDLSTIAKGYAVDQLAELLEKHNVTNYLVEIGGEMRLSGTKPGGALWNIAVEKPVSGSRFIQTGLSITNVAVATSGDYRNYFEQDGKRFSHLIDPSTGSPIQHKLVSVTVLADTCINADGLATALIVMGEEKGMQLAKRENIAALFISKQGEQFIETSSPAYSRLVDQQK